MRLSGLLIDLRFVLRVAESFHGAAGSSSVKRMLAEFSRGGSNGIFFNATRNSLVILRSGRTPMLTVCSSLTA